MSPLSELVKNRRSQYVIGNNTDLTKEEIAERITQIVRDVPTASNSQTTRIAIVFGEENVKLWDHILDVQKDVMPEEMWGMMSGVTCFTFMENQTTLITTSLFS